MYGQLRARSSHSALSQKKISDNGLSRLLDVVKLVKVVVLVLVVVGVFVGVHKYP